jgi:hypothetical protein
MPVEVTVHGRAVSGAWTANWIVAPDCRHLALGPRLMRDLVRRHELTLVAGASAQAIGILPRLGFTHLGNLRRYVLPLDETGVEQLAGQRWSQRAAMIPESRSTTSLSVGRVDRFDDRADQFWETETDMDAGTRRSAAYLNWRYRSHPTFEYRSFQALAGDSVTGIAVYRAEPVQGSSLRVGRVVELLARRGTEDALIRAIHDDARGIGLVLLDFFCSSLRLAPALLSNGWLAEETVPVDIPMLFQPIVRTRRAIPFLAHTSGTVVADFDAWHVTKGDGDQDRPN